MRRVSTCNFTVHILIVSLLSCLSWSSFNNPKTILTLVMMGQLFLLLALVATRFHIKPCVFEKDGMTWTDISCGLHSKGNWGLLQTQNGLKSFMKNNFYFVLKTTLTRSKQTSVTYEYLHISCLVCMINLCSQFFFEL